MSKVRLTDNQAAVLRQALALYVTVGSEINVPDLYEAEAMLREADKVEHITVRLNDGS